MSELLVLTGALDDVARARRFVGEALERWGAVDVDGDVSLITSELVTNAIRHARPPFDLRVRNLAVAVRIEVWDSSPEVTPVRRIGDVVRAAGRGLMLTDELSESWGVEFSSDGRRKCVWVELALKRPVVQIPEPRVDVHQVMTPDH